jgi:hypothetical protein
MVIILFSNITLIPITCCPLRFNRLDVVVELSIMKVLYHTYDCQLSLIDAGYVRAPFSVFTK